MNSIDGQKHFASLFEVQFGTILSQVFRHLGTRFGQDAVWLAPEADAEPDAEPETTPEPDADKEPEADSTYVVMDGLGFDETEIGI